MWIRTNLHNMSSTEAREAHRAELDSTGALVLADFFSAEFVDHVRSESAGREADAFFANSTHNVWLTPPNPGLGDEHIYNR